MSSNGYLCGLLSYNKSYKLQDNEFITIGPSLSATYILHNPNANTEILLHQNITKEWFLANLSTNLVFINCKVNKQYEPHVLAENDIIYFSGPFLFKYTKDSLIFDNWTQQQDVFWSNYIKNIINGDEVIVLYDSNISPISMIPNIKNNNNNQPEEINKLTSENIIKDLNILKESHEIKLKELEQQNVKLQESQVCLENMVKVAKDHEAALFLTLEILTAQLDETRYENDILLAQTIQANQSSILHVAEENLECVICQEIFIEPVSVRCGHVFCRYCVNVWLLSHHTCPICRSSIINTVNHNPVILTTLNTYIESMGEVLFDQQTRDRRHELRAERALTPQTNAAPTVPPITATFQMYFTSN